MRRAGPAIPVAPVLEISATTCHTQPQCLYVHCETTGHMGRHTRHLICRNWRPLPETSGDSMSRITTCALLGIALALGPADQALLLQHCMGKESGARNNGGGRDTASDRGGRDTASGRSTDAGRTRDTGSARSGGTSSTRDAASKAGSHGASRSGTRTNDVGTRSGGTSSRANVVTNSGSSRNGGARMNHTGANGSSSKGLGPSDRAAPRDRNSPGVGAGTNTFGPTGRSNPPRDSGTRTGDGRTTGKTGKSGGRISTPVASGAPEIARLPQPTWRMPPRPIPPAPRPQGFTDSGRRQLGVPPIRSSQWPVETLRDRRAADALDAAANMLDETNQRFQQQLPERLGWTPRVPVVSPSWTPTYRGPVISQGRVDEPRPLTDPVRLGPHPLFPNYDRYEQGGRIIFVPRP